MRTVALAALPLVFVVGCAFDAAPQDTSCPGDQGCPNGQVCAFGLCVDPTDQRLSVVDIEVNGGEGLPVQTEFDVDLKANPRVDISLARGVFVTSNTAAENGDPVDAVIVAQPPRSVPGRVLAPSATTDVDGVFTFLAVEGLTYLMTVSPSSPSFPPIYDLELDAESDDDSGVQLLDQVVVAEGTIHFSGQVVAGEGASQFGIPGLDVRISDEGRRQSSTARTDENGNFTVVLRGAFVNGTLEVVPTADNPSYPSVSTIVDVTDTESIDYGVISLGAVLGPTRFEARVLDADGEPVPNATLSVSGPLGNGTFSTVLIADEQGEIDSSLPPSTYQAFIYGPVERASAGLLVDNALEVPSTAADLVFNLPRRVSFSGAVRDPDDVGLPSAQMTLLRVGSADNEPEPVLANAFVTFTATSDASGQFDVALDPGRYRLTTKPPAGVNVPANSELVVVTEAGLRRDVRLPDRAFVVGTVQFQNAPVGGASVRVFSTFQDERFAAIVLGEGVTGPDGAFEIVVSDLVGVQNPVAP